MGESDGPLQRLRGIIEQFNGTMTPYDEWPFGRNVYFNVFRACKYSPSCVDLARREVNSITRRAESFVTSFACPDCENYTPKPVPEEKEASETRAGATGKL